jgi:hypothetical protein
LTFWTSFSFLGLQFVSFWACLLCFWAKVVLLGMKFKKTCFGNGNDHWAATALTEKSEASGICVSNICDGCSGEGVFEPQPSDEFAELVPDECARAFSGNGSYKQELGVVSPTE